MTQVHPSIKAALKGYEPTDEQWAAISYPKGPLSIIAGAGSGKTAVMAARIAFIVSGGFHTPSEILGLTFTNKAAGELADRVAGSLTHVDLSPGEEVSVFTYNAFADRLVRDYGPKIGIEPEVALLSEAESHMLIARLFEEMTFDRLKVTYLPYLISHVRNLADACANHLIEPEEVAAADEELLKEYEAEGKRVQFKLAMVLNERPEIARLVRAYKDRKTQLGRIDYGDQISLAYRIVSERPEVAEALRVRWPVVLLDEYQDTNVAQREMMRAIYPKGSAITIVGDPDQAIYAWRGATIHNILNFGLHFPNKDSSVASRKPLEVSFRSGARILRAANRIISGIPAEWRGGEKQLRHFEPTGEGEVTADLLASDTDEAELIASEIAAMAGDDGTGINGAPLPYDEVAILCRGRRLFPKILKSLRDHGVPVEVVGLSGLLKTPEIVDLLAHLKMMSEPLANVPFARVAMGPRWRIHFRDLAALARWAAVNTNVLKGRLAELSESAGEVDPGEERFSLSEALGRLDEIEDLSDEARMRLARMHRELEETRAAIRGLTLAEAIEVVLDASGIDAELAAAGTPVAEAARANLGTFLDRAAEFSPVEGEASLAAFLEFLETAGDVEDLEVAQPQLERSVKLMTVHQAKGLEFDLVYIPGMTKDIFPNTRLTDNPLRSVGQLPHQLLPEEDRRLDFSDKNISRFEEALRDRALEEERRLAYVAMTRARKSLRITAAHWYSGTDLERKHPNQIGQFFLELAGAPATEEAPEAPAFEAVQVRTYAECPETNPIMAELEQRAREWPAVDRIATDDLFLQGWRAALDAEVATPGTIDALAEAASVPTAELEAHKTAVATQLELIKAPEPPSRPDERLTSLSVSSMVQLARCPKQFYWTVVRPLPRRPSHAARLGQEIHRWIEIRSIGQQRLEDPEEAPDLAPEELRDRSDAPPPADRTLKAAYEASRFAALLPRYSEQSFVIALEDGYLVRGRMDAVYVTDEGWEIVDFKTGRQPDPNDPNAKLQLAIYAIAARRIFDVAADDLTLTYFYLRDGQEVSVKASELDVDETTLAGLFKIALAEELPPTPSQLCHSCDFLRFCDAGRGYVEADTSTD